MTLLWLVSVKFPRISHQMNLLLTIFVIILLCFTFEQKNVLSFKTNREVKNDIHTLNVKNESKILNRVNKTRLHGSAIEAYMKKIKEDYQICVNEANTTLNDVYLLQVPEKSKCFFKCIALKLELLDKSGKFDVDKSRKAIPSGVTVPDIEMSKMKKCVAKNKKKDLCDGARFIFKCFAKAMKTI